MGSNMARRLKESGYPIAAVYDVNAAVAQSLAQELGCEACADLRQVTKLSDAIITVVTGVVSEGLSTTVLPAAIAGAHFQTAIIIG